MKDAHHHVQLFPVLLLSLHQHQHQIRADAEVLSLIANHQTNEILFNFRQRLLDHLQRVTADGIHLGMELEARDAIAQIHEACARIAAHDLAGLVQARKMNRLGRFGFGNVTAFRDVEE